MSAAPSADPRARFLAVLGEAVRSGSLVKLSLGKYRGADPSLKNLFVRPVMLKDGPHLSFVWRHRTKDLTKNHAPTEALALVGSLIGTEFLDAHLFTPAQTLHLTTGPEGRVRLRTLAVAPGGAGRDAGPGTTVEPAPPPPPHDRPKAHSLPENAAWLRALGVTDERGRPREGMTPKFRQIEKFAELLAHLIDEAGLRARVDGAETPPLRIVDMGSGKGYLTFAVSALLGERAQVLGVEARPGLVDLCNEVARKEGFSARLSFSAGSIADIPLEGVDVLIALHACDTATDDALARGVRAGAALLIVAPCCQKELRPRLVPPPVLEGALRHGIWLEREAEFVTDALRAQLLEWAGYRVKAFEFVSTEHTARNTMIAAVRAGAPGGEAAAARLRAFAAFYGIARQALADQLGFRL